MLWLFTRLLEKKANKVLLLYSFAVSCWSRAFKTSLTTRELSIALWHNYTRSMRNCSKNSRKTSFTCKSPFCASRGMPTATLKFEVNFMQNICKLQTFFVSTVFDRIIGPGTYFKFCVQGGCLIKEGRLFEGLRVCFYDVAFIWKTKKEKKNLVVHSTSSSSSPSSPLSIKFTLLLASSLSAHLVVF